MIIIYLEPEVMVESFFRFFCNSGTEMFFCCFVPEGKALEVVSKLKIGDTVCNAGFSVLKQNYGW